MKSQQSEYVNTGFSTDSPPRSQLFTAYAPEKCCVPNVTAAGSWAVRSPSLPGWVPLTRPRPSTWNLAGPPGLDHCLPTPQPRNFWLSPRWFHWIGYLNPTGWFPAPATVPPHQLSLPALGSLCLPHLSGGSLRGQSWCLPAVPLRGATCELQLLLPSATK